MRLLTCIAAFLIATSLAACSGQGGKTGAVDLLGTAAAEATQIIQQAKATSLVMEAQKQATALMVGSAGQSPAASTTPQSLPVPEVQPPETQPTPLTTGQATPTPSSQGATVELLGVGIGAEGNFIEVYFLAPPAVAGAWYQGNVSVVDEGTGTIYNEIPVVPVVGPLFGKPVEAGQMGYVMLVNAPVRLQAGAMVTVTLGEYVFEHVLVE